ncbi:36.4 kDa proline-rich protein-like [Oryza brachyantha]|uniref:36.4 kDa proline-rich protein-like n=1 Tax=Oryza brachyantha TaxID=4533 RepID=UPI001AD96011|nr:36.4 kDa proline-rich protein-like [Oryza brachyantha]
MAVAGNRRIAVALLLAALALSAQLAPAAACSYCPTPKPPPPPPPPKVKPPPSSVPCPPPPYTPTPTPPTPSPSTGKCPINTLKLLACVDALNGLVHAVVGANAGDTCCPLLSGVADLDAALCLCTAIKAKALGVSLVLPVAISVLVNECGKHVPSSFQCPS